MKKKMKFDYLSYNVASRFQKFHELTKIKHMKKAIPLKYWPETWKTIYHKSYGRFQEVKLPKPNPSKILLSKALSIRASVREFSKKPLGINQISNMLYFSAGIKFKDKFTERRFYPSPGARYPLEVYFLSLNSELPRSFYHYYTVNHSLEKMFDFKKKDLNKITNIPWVRNAGGIVFISAIFERNTVKYGGRGYRHILVEAGHLAQNFYLNATANNVSISAIGGYMDDNINNLLEIDGKGETVIYVLVMGRKSHGQT